MAALDSGRAGAFWHVYGMTNLWQVGSFYDPGRASEAPAAAPKVRTWTISKVLTDLPGFVVGT